MIGILSSLKFYKKVVSGASWHGSEGLEGELELLLCLLVKPSSVIFLPSFSCVLVVSFRPPSPSDCSNQRGWSSKRRHWASSITCWPKTCRGTRKRRRGWPLSHRKYSDSPTGTFTVRYWSVWWNALFSWGQSVVLDRNCAWFAHLKVMIVERFHFVFSLQVRQRRNVHQQTEWQHAGKERDRARKQHGTVQTHSIRNSPLICGLFSL